MKNGGGKFRAFHLWFLTIVLLCSSTLAWSWGSTGHHIINLRAPIHLPDSVGRMKADSLFYAAHASDADNRKVSGDTSFYSESLRHFIDIDYYPNFHSLPHRLDSMIALYGRSTVHNEGTNPWITVVLLDSLTAQLRRNDFATADQTLADLGHYVGDAHQPLHCTKNYDGALTGNSGIHSRYETSMVNNNQNSIIVTPSSVQYISSPIDFVFSYIYQSNSYVDSIMAADTYAKGQAGGATSGATYYNALWQKCGGFTLLQFQRATVDLASLWFTAWVNAQAPQAPSSPIVTSIVGNGTIAPSGTILIQNGRDTTFTFAPATGYHFDSLLVDGVRVDSTASFTFHAVTSSHIITPWFGINRYAITASAGSNGSIVPSGTVAVDYGGSQLFSLSAATGYHIDSLIVDGVGQSLSSGYTFLNVAANHAIRAAFAANIFSLAATAGSHGSISPSGTMQIAYGDSQAFSIRPDSGYFVDSVLIDGVYAGADTSYLFHSVSQSHTIAVRFTDGTVLMRLDVAGNWNLISLPLIVPGGGFTSLFPTASSGAYAFNGSYTQAETLTNGIGYWVRFSGPQSVFLSGHICRTDTIPVQQGWNLIGSVSMPISVNDIGSPDSGVIASSFFEYENGYRAADSLRSGRGYWVKVSQSGRLVLAPHGGVTAKNKIAIRPDGEMPPIPPGAPVRSTAPTSFAMFPAYPNPFNPGTTVRFDLPAESHLSVRIYNLLGQEVLTLVDGIRAAGSYDLRIDGSALTSGVYFVRMEAAGLVNPAKLFFSTQKVVLAK
jgi:hypothetical protein